MHNKLIKKILNEDILFNINEFTDNSIDLFSIFLTSNKNFKYNLSYLSKNKEIFRYQLENLHKRINAYKDILSIYNSIEHKEYINYKIFLDEYAHINNNKLELLNDSKNIFIETKGNNKISIRFEITHKNHIENKVYNLDVNEINRILDIINEIYRENEK